MITYSRAKDFDETQLAELFKSVGWVSGNYPEKLKTAMQNSTRVVSAWFGNKLVGLGRGMDDGAWQATIDCLLVTPEFQRQGIASALINTLLEEYRNFLYINVTPEEKENVTFYQKFGFEVEGCGTLMQIKGKELLL